MANISPIGRVSFPSVFRPKAFEGGEPVYSMVLLFHKSADLTGMKRAAEQAARDKWGAKIPKQLRTPFRDGDDRDTDGYAGHTYVRFASKTPPGVIDQSKATVTEESGMFYAGCHARVSFQAYAYDVSGNRGVAFGLHHIQKVKDGEAFSARTRPEDDFDEITTNDIDDIDDMLS